MTKSLEYRSVFLRATAVLYTIHIIADAEGRGIPLVCNKGTTVVNSIDCFPSNKLVSISLGNDQAITKRISHPNFPQ